MEVLSFKPYYKWITFNIEIKKLLPQPKKEEVLNLIINGLPSISKGFDSNPDFTEILCFKPYYKWITFNIEMEGEE